MTDLVNYFFRISSGLFLITMCYLLLPKKTDFPKIGLLIFGFILIRDAMTPMGFWQLGLADSFIVWFRFVDDSLLLITLGLMSLVTTVLIIYFNPSLNRYVYWIGSSKTVAVVTGVTGAAAVSIPFLFLYSTIPIEQRGDVFSPTLLFPLLTLTMFGNVMEEVLFRGYLQGYFETITTPGVRSCYQEDSLLLAMYFSPQQ